MSIRRRAFLYLMRNQKKTCILLIILTVISALILLCISIGSAADASLQKLREQMGGYFKIETDYTQGKVGTVDDGLVQNVVDLGGIKAVNGMDVQYLMTEDIELFPGRFYAGGDEKASLARFLGNTDSSLNEYFLLKYYILSAGRHIAADDYGKVLISDDLAKRNQLSVGDTIKARFLKENVIEGQKGSFDSHTLEIVGIFQIDFRQGSVGADTAECDIEENFIFTDTAFIREAYGETFGSKTNLYTGGVSFFVENPKELEGICDRLLSSGSYNWDDYSIVKNNKTYEDSAVPLERLSALVFLMVFIINIVSIIMLSLILFLWMRERMHETGIYLSIGIRKTELLLQRILENITILAAAFLLAWGIGAAVSEIGGQTILDFLSETREETQTAEQMTEQSLELDISIGAVELAEIAGMEILIVLFSTGASSVAALRMRPKDILSKM